MFIKKGINNVTGCHNLADFVDGSNEIALHKLSVVRGKEFLEQ
jgi:hypothetical protein